MITVNQKNVNDVIDSTCERANHHSQEWLECVRPIMKKIYESADSGSVRMVKKKPENSYPYGIEMWFEKNGNPFYAFYNREMKKPQVKRGKRTGETILTLDSPHLYQDFVDEINSLS